MQVTKPCARCNKPFSGKFKDETGKWISSTRRFCFDCSPFRGKNRRSLDKYPIIDGIEHKTCTKCQLLKSIHDFYIPSSKTKSYRTPWCKNCFNEHNRNRRYNVKTRAIEYLGGKCSRCSLIDHPAVYDFHHVDGKDFQLGSEFRNSYANWDKIQSELDKCILLCANCHRKEHAGTFTRDKEAIH